MNRVMQLTQQNSSRKSLTSLLIGHIFIALILTACSGIPISYYDATTYTQLTSLKAETTTLVESFDKKALTENQVKIEETSLALKKAYEYEKGKGDLNGDTTKQFDKITDLFMDDVKEYTDNGPGALGAKYFQEAATVLGQAFDIAISTENLKNKDKR